MAIILNTRRQGYGTDQVERTMTVGELIEALEFYDKNAPIYFGNMQFLDDNGERYWYTYGGITEAEIFEYEEDKEEDE